MDRTIENVVLTTAPRRFLTPAVVSKLGAAISKKPRTLVELAKIGNLDRRVLKRYVDQMRAANMLRVVGWQPDTFGRMRVRLYGWGSEPDAVAPRVSDAERMRAMRAAYKAEGYRK